MSIRTDCSHRDKYEYIRLNGDNEIHCAMCDLHKLRAALNQIVNLGGMSLIDAQKIARSALDTAGGTYD